MRLTIDADVQNLIHSFRRGGLNDRGDVVRAALDFAAKVHAAQRRKYTGELYIAHPIEIMTLVDYAVGADVAGREDMLAAALLHDTIEDTETTAADIEARFGADILRMVLGLTDVSKPSDGNRAARKAMDLAHLSDQDGDVHTIKCGDIISNTRSITRFDLPFARVYLPEKRAQLDVLTRADRGLWALADAIVQAGLAQTSA